MRRIVLLFVCVALSLFVVGCASSQRDTPGPDPIPEAPKIMVPNLLSLDRQDAEKLLANSGLLTGKVGYDYSDTIPNGHVMAQNPAAMTPADFHATVDITISKGKKAPDTVAVPDLIGKTQPEAEKALRDAHLVPVQGKPVVSTKIEPGKVCEQSVSAGTTVQEGTQVVFAIAVASNNVAVPDEVGKLKDDAIADLEKAGLGADTSTAYSGKVEAGKVISQSVAGGTRVPKGTVISLQISLGPQPVQKVAVPDIITYTREEAIAALQSAGLDYRYTGEDDGTVIAVDPAVGTEVEVGSTVTFTLQHESTLVEVPDVAGMTGANAWAVMNAQNLELDYDTDHPERVLEATNPAAGTQVDIASVIDAIYPPEPKKVKVPDVAGMSGSDAQDVMDDAGLELDYDTDNPDRVLQGTDPAAGTEVELATVVDAVYPPEPEQVKVPDVAGMSGSDAQDVMDDAGLELDYDTDDPDRVLQGTDPAAGTMVDYATVVDAIYPPEPTPPDPGELPGSWTGNETAAKSTLTDDEEDVFDEVMVDAGKRGLDPVATLAMQVVAGQNYAFLGQQGDDWCVVIGNVAPDGTVSYLSHKDFAPGEAKTTDSWPSGTGAWQVNEGCAGKLPKVVSAAFDAAMEDYEGPSVKPVALLATQPVAGVNYEVLCVGDDALYVAVIYTDASGDSSVTSMEILDIVSYAS